MPETVSMDISLRLNFGVQKYNNQKRLSRGYIIFFFAIFGN